jgi:putative ABC transport system permease protein
MKNKDLGFDKDEVIYLPLKSETLNKNARALKTEIKASSRVVNATATSRIVGDIYGGWSVKTPEQQTGIEMSALFTDFDFVDTFGLEIIEGRDFSRDISTDATEAFLLNQSAAGKIGLQNAIGQPLEISGGLKGNVIGVLKDFNAKSLHTATEPLIVSYIPHESWNQFLAVKINPGPVQDVLDNLAAAWKTFEKDIPFEYFFLDERLDAMYKNEERFGRLIIRFALLAVFIGCLGMFGLSAFTIEKRTKEIGMRKVLGASMSNLLVLLSKEFIWWVTIANIIAWPIAYFAMERWLRNFAFRIGLNPLTFLAAGLSALLITLLTVGYHALKASRTNPIHSLKYE